MGSDNILEMFKNRGFCRELKGYVHICMVFMDLPGHYWIKTEIVRQLAVYRGVLRYLEQEAGKHGVSLHFTDSFEHLRSKQEWDKDSCKRFSAGIAKKHGCASLTAYAQQIRRSTGAYQIAFAYMFKRPSRSFADPMSCNQGPSEDAEAIFVYDTAESTFLHELLHLFGAADLYYPAAVKAAADRWLPDSVMRTGKGRKIDGLTRYLIGWTNVLSPEAAAVYRTASSCTMQDVSQSPELIQDSPNATVPRSEGTYYGPIRGGLWHGRGRFVFANGDVYEGDFVDGHRTGKGRYVFANGSVYTGDFVDGQMHGRGTLTYRNGRSVSGVFVRNRYTGKR